MKKTAEEGEQIGEGRENEEAGETGGTSEKDSGEQRRTWNEQMEASDKEEETEKKKNTTSENNQSGKKRDTEAKH